MSSASSKYLKSKYNTSKRIYSFEFYFIIVLYLFNRFSAVCLSWLNINLSPIKINRWPVLQWLSRLQRSIFCLIWTTSYQKRYAVKVKTTKWKPNRNQSWKWNLQKQYQVLLLLPVLQGRNIFAFIAILLQRKRPHCRSIWKSPMKESLAFRQCMSAHTVEKFSGREPIYGNIYWSISKYFKKMFEFLAPHGSDGFNNDVLKIRERKYSCPTCPRGFTSNFKLIEHIRVHTKTYPFKCTHCEKTYRTLSLLNHHIVSFKNIYCIFSSIFAAAWYCNVDFLCRKWCIYQKVNGHQNENLSFTAVSVIGYYIRSAAI